MIRKAVFYPNHTPHVYQVGEENVTSINIITEGDSKMASIVMDDGSVIEFRNTPYWLERI